MNGLVSAETVGRVLVPEGQLHQLHIQQLDNFCTEDVIALGIAVL